MRKLKLLIAAAAMLVSLGAQAQSWTGSVVGEGYALLYNVGKAQYFTRGNGWDTQASVGGEGAAMTVYLKEVNGKYLIRTLNTYGLEHLSGGTVYTDQSRDKQSTWTFTEIDATNHIYNIISADNHGGGAGTYLTAESGTTIVGPGTDGNDNNAKWKVYLYTDQQAQLQTAMANATAAAPVDVTAYIKDANFGAYSDIALECWSKTVTNWNLNGGNLTNPCAETYHNGGGIIYQTITVPNGTYKVKCQGYYRKDGGSTPSYLYANDVKEPLKVLNANNEGTAETMTGASASFTSGYYETETGEVVVTGRSLTIGIEGQSDNWTCFDNFRLSYLGPLDLSAFEQGLSDAVDAATATNGTIPTACYNAIASVVSENNKTYENSDDYEAAINAINNAIATYASSAIVAAYAQYKALAANVDAIDDDNTVYTGSATIDLSDANTEVEAATTLAGINSAISTVRGALKTFLKAVTVKDGKCFDLTFMIVNPHFTEGAGGTAIPTGWTLENGAITEHRILTHNFEAYHTPFNLSQTIPSLPKGTYKVTLQGFARHDNASVTDKTNLYCGPIDKEIKNITAEWSETSYFSNGMTTLGDINYDSYDESTGYYRPNGMTGAYYWFQETNSKTNQPFYTNEVSTLLTDEGDLKIGFKCEANADWVIWDNFHLYYYGSTIAVELDEAAGTSFTEEISGANVTLNKTIFDGWNTITIPFEANASNFGGEKLYSFSGDDETTLNFTEVTTGKIEPNIPYLLKATSASSIERTFSGVTVKVADGQTVTGTNYSFVGTYLETAVADGDYILGENDFYRSSGGNKVKAYRAYVKKIVDTGSQARLAFVLDGMTTAIDAIDGKAVNNAAIYNLSGQKVEKAQKGIYIQNGKKMVIK